MNAGHGADCGADGHEERQKSQALDFADGRALQIMIQDGVRLMGKSAMPEVHQEKGEIVENVDIGKPGIELDGIEQPRLALPQDDIAQMQIAVALPDKALLLASRHQSLARVKVLAKAGERGLEIKSQRLCLRHAKSAFEIAGNMGNMTCKAGVPNVRGVAMKMLDHPGERQAML